MIRIRLQRKGRKKRPIYHIVVADSRSPRDGRIIELVGRYDGVTENKEVVLNEERILHWLETGAQPSDTVRKILRNSGVLYKRHLKMWGKTDAEIEAALAEWKAYKESKSKDDSSRKDKHKTVLAAEEKEYKKQLEQKASEAAKSHETAKKEKAAAEESAEAAEEITAEDETVETAEAAEAETTIVEESVVEAETPAAEEEPATEETAAEEAPAAEESAVEEEIEKAEQPAADGVQTSTGMTAKDAADHIKNTELADLEGFIGEDETRKTVLAAWESKQAEG